MVLEVRLESFLVIVLGFTDVGMPQCLSLAKHEINYLFSTYSAIMFLDIRSKVSLGCLEELISATCTLLLCFLFHFFINLSGNDQLFRKW